MKRDTHKQFLDTTYPSQALWLVGASRKEAKHKVRGILSQPPAKNVKVMLQQNFVLAGQMKGWLSTKSTTECNQWVLNLSNSTFRTVQKKKNTMGMVGFHNSSFCR